MPTMKIQLTKALEKIVRDRVESGLFEDESDVIRDAIRQSENQINQTYESRMQELREALAVGIQQSEAGQVKELTYEQILHKLDAKK